MANYEKVIKGLFACTTDPGNGICPTDCPYMDSDICDYELMMDALELMKREETVEPKLENDGKRFWYECGGCEAAICPGDNYCHKCGKAIKWPGREPRLKWNQKGYATKEEDENEKTDDL